MAAYEVRFNYRYGIVAYVNGAEIFRDNMPSGSVTAESTASRHSRFGVLKLPTARPLPLERATTSFRDASMTYSSISTISYFK